MTKSIIALPALALTTALLAHAQAAAGTKVGIIQLQQAILATKDGQKAVGELRTRFEPKRTELEKKQANIASMQDQLRKGSATMSEDAKNKLVRDIDQATKSLNRDTEDAQAEVEQAENKIMQELGGRIMAVVDKYAKDNGYALILDVSNPQAPVVFAASSIDITREVIDLYDKNAPAATTSAPAAAPAAPAAPKPAAPATKK